MSILKKSLVAIAAAGLFGCSHLSESEREQEERAAADQVKDQTARTTAQARTSTRKRPAEPSLPEKRVEERRVDEKLDEARTEVRRDDPANTGINERDRGEAAPTPMDQGNSAEDLRITADIRKALMKEDALSFTAKNVKIITRDGQVLLRGPVKTSIEKARIDTIARTIAGVIRVDDQLEVEPTP